MPYFDTNNEIGETLKKSREKALTQEDLILKFFDLHTKRSYTPFEIQRRVLPDCPITSVRRAMTCLADLGVLEKTDRMKAGEYGKMNHTWKRTLFEFTGD